TPEPGSMSWMRWQPSRRSQTTPIMPNGCTSICPATQWLSVTCTGPHTYGEDMRHRPSIDC
ncbi:hypothetical protein ABTI05_19565, partial [Acinetobacter baumannii]